MRDWLKQKRLEHEYTLTQLSDIVGVSEQSLSYYENGDRRPTPEVSIALGKALDFDWRLFYEEEKKEGA